MSDMNSARSRRGAEPREQDQQGRLSQLVQGGIFLGVMLLLFVLAGFRG
ncbi:hypothetical protein SAMN02927895_00506 [Belnapia rosea]|nr:hypothetical protein SAMN02927895_00506 [Belnapia rosea]